MGGVSFAADHTRQHSLFIRQFGEERCQPSYAFGPHVREYFLIHYVVSGCGVLHCGGKSYSVTAGQGFLILPNEETCYQADANTPWHYAWVGYQGTQAKMITCAAGLDEMHRVFTALHPQEAWQALEQMRTDAKELRLLQMSAIGSLLRFLSLIAPEQNTSAATLARQYCEKAQWYLEGRYDHDVSIQEAANFVGLSRSQLYRVMIMELGCSPKALLLQIRMQHACELLSSTNLTMESIAHRIGMQTSAQLGAAFKSFYGISPGEYRKNGDNGIRRNR